MASEKTFQLEILTLQKSCLRVPVKFVVAPGQEGVFEILPGHAPFVFALKPGVVRLNLADDQNQYLAVGGGFLVVQPDQTTVLARSAERPEEIDSARAERAKERAVALLANKTGVIDEPRAAAAFQRALARLKVASYVQSVT